jgi:hypothetical protein
VRSSSSRPASSPAWPARRRGRRAGGCARGRRLGTRIRHRPGYPDWMLARSGALKGLATRRKAPKACGRPRAQAHGALDHVPEQQVSRAPPGGDLTPEDAVRLRPSRGRRRDVRGRDSGRRGGGAAAAGALAGPSGRSMCSACWPPSYWPKSPSSLRNPKDGTGAARGRWCRPPTGAHRPHRGLLGHLLADRHRVLQQHPAECPCPGARARRRWPARRPPASGPRGRMASITKPVRSPSDSLT